MDLYEPLFQLYLALGSIVLFKLFLVLETLRFETNKLNRCKIDSIKKYLIRIMDQNLSFYVFFKYLF